MNSNINAKNSKLIPKTNNTIENRIYNVCGIVAPILFVTIFTIDGWFRHGYSPISRFVSELSIGHGGWVQMTNFFITGLLLFIFGLGQLSYKINNKPTKAISYIFMVMGFCLFGSGFFTTDPSVLFNQHTFHGIVHGILGAIFFTLAPVSCFVIYKTLKINSNNKLFKRWSLFICLVLLIGIVFLKISQFPQNELFQYKGLIQRIILISYMLWLFSYAFRNILKRSENVKA